METLFDSPLIGIVLVCASYGFGVFLHKKTGLAILNPVLISMVICIGVMNLLDISLEQFNRGASVIGLFLIPGTCVLALSIYRQREILGQYFVPIVCGCVVSTVVSIVGSFVLGYLFGLNEVIILSTVASSATSPIAIDVTNQLGGLVPIAILCVMITGIGGAVFAPTLIKWFGITDEVEMGVAIGASSHVVGTSKAVQLGEIQGAMSGLAIGVAGLSMVFLTLLMQWITG